MFVGFLVEVCLTFSLQYMGLYVFNWHILVSRWLIVIIFFRGCVPEVFVTSYYITYCIYVPGKPGICYLCSLWWVQVFGYVLACRSYSFVCTVQYLIIIIVQIYLKALNLWKARQIYLSSVWVWLSIFSPLSIIWGCMFSVYPFLLWWLR